MASFAAGVTEIGYMAHARRKFFDLHASNKSHIAAKTLAYIQRLYDVERSLKDASAEHRLQRRQELAKPILDTLHHWMIAQRQLVQEGSAIAKALDYSLKRWTALIRYLNDGNVPIDNSRMRNQIRPWALGRSNWLLAGSFRSARRAAATMNLIQSAKLNGSEPYAYLKDVLTGLSRNGRVRSMNCCHTIGHHLTRCAGWTPPGKPQKLVYIRP